MNILFCNYEYPPIGGGGGVMNALLAHELAKRHQVTILTSQALGLPRERYEDGVRVVRVPVLFRKRKSVATMQSLLVYIASATVMGRALIDQNDFDLINTHFVLPSGPVGNALGNYADIPNVLSVHGGDLYDPSKFTSPHRHPILRSWVRWLIRQADMVVGQSNNTLSNLNLLYTPEINAVRIPLGIRQPDIDCSRVDYGRRREEVVLITVGRLIKRKAVHHLLAMMKVLRRYPVRLIIVGSGPQEQHLKLEAHRMQVEDKVQFTGYVDEQEKYRLLRLSDVYVSTTQHEGFCLAFLEAMAMGLPIITYDHGGHTDFLSDRHTGFLIPLNNLDDFIHKCKNLILDPCLRLSLGENNLERIKDYKIELCATRYENIYNQTLSQRQITSQIKVGNTSTARESR